MLNDAELTERLSDLLQDTANEFLRIAQDSQRSHVVPAEYEICLAVRRRATNLDRRG